MNSKALFRPLLITAVSLALACSSKSAGMEEESGSSSSQAEEDGSESDSTGGQEEQTYAQGITLHDIRANQGAAIPLWLDGSYQDGAVRRARLIAGRDTLFRAAWTLDDGWEARQIRGVLVLEGAEGPRSYEDTVTVSGASDLAQAEGAFDWLVPAEEVEAGVGFYVELFEVEDAFLGTAAPAEPPRYPPNDSLAVGIEGAQAVMQVVVVPVHVDDGDATQSPELAQDTVDKFRDALFVLHPVQSINLEVHETGVTVSQGGNTALGETLNHLQQLRASENIPDDVFLYGLLPGYEVGTTCLTWNGSRSAVGFEADPDLSYSSVHCAGLSMGLTHVQCPEEGMPPYDGAYPYADGLIGTWGYNVLTGELLNPATHYSSQTFCDPSWYSDYEWMQFSQHLWN